MLGWWLSSEVCVMIRHEASLWCIQVINNLSVSLLLSDGIPALWCQVENLIHLFWLHTCRFYWQLKHPAHPVKATGTAWGLFKVFIVFNPSLASYIFVSEKQGITGDINHCCYVLHFKRWSFLFFQVFIHSHMSSVKWHHYWSTNFDAHSKKCF